MKRNDKKTFFFRPRTLPKSRPWIQKGYFRVIKVQRPGPWFLKSIFVQRGVELQSFGVFRLIVSMAPFSAERTLSFLVVAYAILVRSTHWEERRSFQDKMLLWQQYYNARRILNRLERRGRGRLRTWASQVQHRKSSRMRSPCETNKTSVTERKFKTKASERHVAKNPWKSPGSNLRRTQANLPHTLIKLVSVETPSVPSKRAKALRASTLSSAWIQKNRVWFFFETPPQTNSVRFHWYWAAVNFCDGPQN